MEIKIGNGNTMQGNINIGKDIQQDVRGFNQQVALEKLATLMDSLHSDIQEYYDKEDKEAVIEDFNRFKEEILKTSEERDSGLIKNILHKLEAPFQFIAGSSSIAGLIVALCQIF